MARNLLPLTKLVLLAAAMSAALAGTASAQGASDQRATLLLMGTVPIYWGEADDIADQLRGGASAHWARGVLEEQFQLVPLDTITSDRLARNRFMLMAQPRTLSGAENIALNGWVRSGGHLLLLADPMMTGDSRFAIGDRRRPQDVALLSPILTHWGLDLQFDDSIAPGLTMADAGAVAIPVNLPGQLALRESATCDLLGDGIAARCQLGRGSVLVIADAAMLDHAGPYPGAQEALAALIDSIFAGNGEITGEFGSRRENAAIPGLSAPSLPAYFAAYSP
jgi:hypothetical protein